MILIFPLYINVVFIYLFVCTLQRMYALEDASSGTTGFGPGLVEANELTCRQK
jgi:hypothetical protein